MIPLKESSNLAQKMVYPESYADQSDTAAINFKSWLPTIIIWLQLYACSDWLFSVNDRTLLLLGVCSVGGDYTRFDEHN